MSKTVILIDGQNLFYSLKDIGIIEKNLNWKKFLKSLTSDEDQLLRTYWFRPLKILDTFLKESNIKSQIVKKEHPSYCKAYFDDKTKIPIDIITKINEKYTEISLWIEQEKTKFSQIEFNYDQIVLHNEDIEIVKKGVVKLNPYFKQYIGEKGVDISLAVKMISLSVEKKCDKIILISGDYDYAEAINYIKNNMTKIHIVKIHKGFPPKNKNLSRDLAVLADKVIDVYEEELRKYLI